LVWAAEGKQAFNWELQSCLMALMANLNKTKKQKPHRPADFNPLLKIKQKKKIEVGAVVSHLMPPELAAKYAELARAKAAGKESGDWTEFNRLAAKFKC
jgi:threonine dehydrogenase-like Zn-dependent dehydrogenase